MNFKHFHRFWGAGLDLLFPPRCLLCRTWEEPFALPMLCEPCWARLYHPREIILPQFGEKPTRAYATGEFVEGLRSLVLQAKFKAKPLALPPLRRALREASRSVDFPSLDKITTIPMDRKRTRQRGIFLPAILARSLAREVGAPYRPQALRRIRRVPPQTSLPRSKRMENVRGIFSSEDRIANKHLLLIDDVCTTGATVASAAQALYEGGAESVTVMVCAQTPLGHHD